MNLCLELGWQGLPCLTVPTVILNTKFCLLVGNVGLVEQLAPEDAAVTGEYPCLYGHVVPLLQLGLIEVGQAGLLLTLKDGECTLYRTAILIFLEIHEHLDSSSLGLSKHL